MEQPIISSRLFFFSLVFGILVLFISTLGKIFSTKTNIALCNNEGSMTVYIRLNNKHDILINPKSLKSALSCVGRYMPFYDRTIEFLLADFKKKPIIDEIKSRYNITNITSSTNVNFKMLGNISYDKQYVEYKEANESYLILLKEISPFDLNKRLTSKNYSLVFMPKYSEKYGELVESIKKEKIQIALNNNYVYFVNPTL